MTLSSPHSLPLLILAGALASLMATPARGAPGPGHQASGDSSLVMAGLDLSVTLDVDEGRLEGTAGVSIRNVGPRPARSVSFLLGRLLSVSGATDDADGALVVSQDVVVFEDESALQVTQAVIQLRRPLAPGASTTVQIDYGGILVGYTEVGLLYVRDRVTREFTILREDAFAFPVLGVPSYATNRASPREPFRFTLEVTAPAELFVATGGELVGRRVHKGVEGFATTTYRSREPVPFLNVAVAPYRISEGGDVRVFHFAEDEAGARDLLAATGKALGLLSRWFGPPGVQPQVTVIEIPEGFGSQASLSGGILQTADAFRRPEARHELYHELSHLWNAPDLDAPSPRWNEGLGRFLEWRLAAEIDHGVDLDARAEETAKSLVERCRKEPRCATVPLVRYGEEGMTDFSYRVGHLFFHLLYRLAGPSGFDAALGAHQRDHRDSGGTTDALTTSILRAVPQARALVDDWLLTTRWLERLHSSEGLRAMADGGRAPTARIQLRVDTSEAEAVLDLLQATAPAPESSWERLFATEPYVRLKQREAAMNRPFTDREFRAFVESGELTARAGELERTLEVWRQADLDAAARRVLPYLPDEAVIRASVYLVIKPKTNSFVFDVRSDPAIFLYLDPKVTARKLENTVAHELHHIGYASLAELEEKALTRLAPNVRAAAEWMGAFGEGFAMLAAAGGPDTHPHAASEPEERARWDHDTEDFAEDVATLDAFFLDIIEGRFESEEAISEKGRSFFGVQGPWYTVGYRMAKVIEEDVEHGGRAALIVCMSDPAELLATYNRAALANGNAPSAALWSPELLRYLEAPAPSGGP